MEPQTCSSCPGTALERPLPKDLLEKTSCVPLRSPKKSTHSFPAGRAAPLEGNPSSPGIFYISCSALLALSLITEILERPLPKDHLEKAPCVPLRIPKDPHRVFFQEEQHHWMEQCGNPNSPKNLPYPALLFLPCPSSLGSWRRGSTWDKLPIFL